MNNYHILFLNYIFFGICVTAHVIEKEGKFESIITLLLSVMFWPVYLIYLEYIND